MVKIPNYMEWYIHTTWRYFKHAVREVGGEVKQTGIRDGRSEEREKLSIAGTESRGSKLKSPVFYH